MFNTPIVSPQWLKDNQTTPNLVILHAYLKERKNSSDLAIAGARLFDMKNVFRDKENPLPNTVPDPEYFAEECRKLGINKNSKIVLYDKLGVATSPRAWWLFRLMGHQEVTILNGGLPAWEAEGFATTTPSKEAYKYGDFQADFQAALLKTTQDVYDNIQQKKAVHIDARSKGRFDGTQPEIREGIESGHVPNSINLYSKEVLENGKFKSKEALTAIFKSLALEDKPLVFACGSGVSACVLLIASEIASDQPTAIYDGSWTEWAKTEGMPIEKS